jgi:hypothetical protein
MASRERCAGVGAPVHRDTFQWRSRQHTCVTDIFFNYILNVRSHYNRIQSPATGFWEAGGKVVKFPGIALGGVGKNRGWHESS